MKLSAETLLARMQRLPRGMHTRASTARDTQTRVNAERPESDTFAAAQLRLLQP